MEATITDNGSLLLTPETEFERSWLRLYFDHDSLCSRNIMGNSLADLVGVEIYHSIDQSS